MNTGHQITMYQDRKGPLSLNRHTLFSESFAFMKNLKKLVKIIGKAAR